ncbi:hypothetical protein D8674_013638 [Pyrus ussuriensis x Pyrus communis]|uniref:Uncharacterized protein n=1 Tax=Pyrus ussuriensis x Pyrus communis TaxID=2448454 RepID=A0A5N5GQC9_9ROSA|nr:hypothetical protein D8674_013638 [Pyrus ussuriensis x Pyrus communis]
MHHRLNDLHRPRAGLNSSIFFEERTVHSLGPAWTSRVLIAMENNMPTANWFTPNPYSVESGILTSKWFTHRKSFSLMTDESWLQWVDELEPIWKRKWMNNGIYKLIMLSKVTMITKLELLTTTLLFWNTGTNIFDFQMGTSVLHRYPWFSDQIFQDVFGEDASSLYKEKFMSCIQQKDLAWRVARQEAGSSHTTKNAEDFSELFEDSEAEAGPEVDKQTPRQARATVMESSESEPEERPTPQLALPEVTSSQASQATSWASPSASSKATARTEVPFPSIKVPSQASSKGSGNSHPPSASKVDPPQPSKATSPPLLLPEAPSSTQVYHIFFSRSAQGNSSSAVTRIPIPRPKKINTDATSASATFGLPLPILTEATSADAAFGGVRVIPPPFASILATTSLPELVREFGQIKTKLRSPRHHSESQLLQDARKVFREWMQMDFIASFSLKAL